MKKLLLTIVMTVAAMLTCQAFTVDGVNYSVSDGVATVTGATSKGITRLVIPATVTSGGKTYPVNYVGSRAFINYSSLKELIIEDSDTEICCPWYVNDKGWSVMGNPFEGCPLEKIYIGRNTALRYSNGDYRADHLPFYPTTHNLDLTIAGKATFVLSGAVPGSFRGFSNLRSLTLGGSVQKIYKQAFKNCESLKNVTILAGDTELNFVDEEIFMGCSIDTLILSRTVSSYRSESMGNMTINTAVITPELNILKNGTLRGMNNVGELIIEDSETPIKCSDFRPFEGCEFENVYLGREAADDSYSSSLVNSCKIKNLTFGPVFSEINNIYCHDRQELETVTFSSDITKIATRAFYNCSNLASIELPESVTEIKEGAFSGCSSLTEIKLPSSLSIIGNTAFAYCPKITELVIPASVKSLGMSVLYQNRLKTLVLEDNDTPIICTDFRPFGECVIDSVYMGRAHFDDGYSQTLLNDTKVYSIEFGQAVKVIDSGYCSRHAELERVKLSENVTQIADYSFTDCVSLKSINIPDKVTQINGSAFNKCSSLEDVTLPKSLEHIGPFSFYECTSLKSISIPASVTTIDYDAFADCTGIKKLVLEDGDAAIDCINFRPFENCAFDSVYVGRKLGENGYNSTIFGSASIKNITFGPAITEIDYKWCSNHQEIQSLSLSSNVSKISNNAFSGCTGLTAIHSMATVPPVCENKDVFANEVYDVATVIVPMGTKKSYREAEVWKLFSKLASDGDGYKVTANYDSSMGDVMLNGVSTSTAMLDEDEPLTVVISPKENHEIASVTVNGVDVTGKLIDNTLSYNALDSNLDIKVEFRIITYSITIPTEIKGGRILIEGTEDGLNPDSITIGRVVTITLVPDRGHSLSALTVNGSDFIETLNESLSFNLLIDRDITIDAIFTPEVYSVKAVSQSSDYGTVTLNGESGECRVEFGQPLTIKLMPRDEGCYFVSLTVDGTDVTADVADNTYTVDSVEADMTVEAEFGFYTYTIEYSCNPEQGSITSGLADDNGTGVTVAHGSDVVLTITPAEGFEIATVVLDGKDVTANVDGNGNLTLPRVNANHRVEATFDIKRVYLTVLGLDGGQIAMRYDYGSEVTLLIETEEGWEFHSLTVGNLVVTELEADGSFTTPALTDDTAVSVVFTLAGESGADVPAEASLITVTAVGHTIMVEGAADNDAVEVFDTNGITLYRGTDHVIDLNHNGVHIVRVAGRTFKVMLR